MLKFTIIFLAVLAIGLVHATEGSVKDLAICAEQEGATEKDMEIMEKRTNPDLKVLKCVEACLAERSGEVVDKKLNVDGWEAYVNKRYSGKEGKKMNEIYKAVANNCKSVTDEDRCEMIVKLRGCLNDSARKYGVKSLY